MNNFVFIETKAFRKLYDRELAHSKKLKKIRLL
jgi:hypothetical protein